MEERDERDPRDRKGKEKPEPIETDPATEEKIAKEFMDTVMPLAFESKRRGEDIIIGIDDSWIPPTITLQPLLTAISRLGRSRSFNNIIVVRGRNGELAYRIKEKIRGPANIVVIGNKADIPNGTYKVVKEHENVKKFFFAGVDPSRISKVGIPAGENYIRILEMITIALDLAFRDPDVSVNELLRTLSAGHPNIVIALVGPDTFILIPAAEPFEIEDIKELYATQRDVIYAA